MKNFNTGIQVFRHKGLRHRRGFHRIRKNPRIRCHRIRQFLEVCVISINPVLKKPFSNYDVKRSQLFSQNFDILKICKFSERFVVVLTQNCK